MYYSKIQLKKLVNLLAEFLSILHKEKGRLDRLSFIFGYKKLTEEYINQLEHTIKLSPNEFLDKLDELKKRVCTENIMYRQCIAREISIWIDAHLTYYYQQENRISLFPICKINATKPVFIESLNENVEETKIWINPKFPVYKMIDEETGKNRMGEVNKSSWEGINGDLNCVSYFVWDGCYRIKNVIIPDTSVCDKKGDFLTVAFAPMTNEKDLLNRTDVEAPFEGRIYEAFELSLDREPDYFSQRLKNDLGLASNRNVDIVFMPEMLGTSDSCGEGKRTIDWVKSLSELLLDNSKHVPAMTVLPSYWHKRINSATIVFKNGLVLGVQNKYEPYVSRIDRKVEALKECIQKEMTIIHIPGIHRMAVIICSEYLADLQVKWSDILCRCLGVTLILVPSFSPGEQAFYQTLNRYTEFGTIVVWGNCCGAIRSDNKGIGGCSISSLNIQDRFGQACMCQNTCKNHKSCIFTERLAVQMTLSKDEDHAKEHCLKHYVE